MCRASLGAQQSQIRASIVIRSLCICVTIVLAAQNEVLALCGGRLVQTPTLGAHNQLWAAAAASATDAWAIGEVGTFPYRPIIERWDGTRWRLIAHFRYHQSIDLNSVAAAGSDAWFAGDGPNVPSCYEDVAAATRFDGQTWSYKPSQFCSDYFTAFYSIVAFSADDVWAAGDFGYSGGPQPVDTPLLAHWDGHRWAPSYVPTYYSLLAVAGVPPRDIWTVSRPYYFHKDVYADIIHRAGGGWVAQQFDFPERYGDIEALAVLSDRDVWAVGRQATSGYDAGRPLIEHWNGVAWTEYQLRNVDGLQLKGIAAISSSDVWAVGGGGSTPFVVHWDGTRWSRVTVRLAGALSGVARVPGTNDVIAVGNQPDSTNGIVALSVIYGCN